MDECPSGLHPVAGANGIIHCVSDTADPLAVYLVLAWFALIFGLALAGWLRGKLTRKPLSVDGWTLRNGFWEKDAQ
jgi:hypothetical protein